MAKKSKKKSPRPSQTAKLIRRLFAEYLPAYKAPLICAVACMLVAAVSTASIAWLMRLMVNGIFVEGQKAAIWVVGSAVMAAFFAKGIAGYFQATLIGSVGISIVSSLQKRQFDKLMTMGMDHYAGVHAAKHVAKVLRSSRAARTTISLVLTNIFRDAFTLVALVSVMVMQDPLMSVIGLAGAPVLIFGVIAIIRRTRDLADMEDDNAAGVSAAVTEAIQGFRVVKSFNLEGEMSRRVARNIDRVESRQKRLNRIVSLTSPMMDVAAGFLIGAFIFYAGWQTLSFGKTPGEFMAFITAFLLAYEPARRLANFNVELNRQIVPVHRMYELFDMPSGERTASLIAPPAASRSGSLSFQGVSFAYADKSPVLHDVSFDAPAGTKVALVGRSGAGKSTIFSLILGIYHDHTGTILVDGMDSATAASADVRSGISYVSQETFLFTGTVRENIRFGRKDASDEDVVEAARAANAISFIEALPEGFDTRIGGHEGLLSGGERQRIAIARALVKDAPILLLDEATSALDGETERAVRNAESHLVSGRTTIVIAHRLSTIIEADEIIVLDAGRVVGRGRHAELIASNDIYQSLFSEAELGDTDSRTS